MQIPRIINALWLQGEENAPILVRKCLQRWKALNPDYEMRIYNKEDVLKILPPFPFDINRLSDQALSDIFRIYLLYTQGGVWTDATVYPNIPLSNWLNKHSQGGFFAFPGHRPPLDVSSWFLAAHKEHIIPTALWHKITEYWSHPRKLISYAKEQGGFMENYKQKPLYYFSDEQIKSNYYPYFWLMYMFTGQLACSEAFKASWSSVTKRNALSAHAVFFGLREKPAMPEEEIKTAFAKEVMQKLTWRNEKLSEHLLSLPFLFDQG